MTEHPTADDVARAIVAACRETGDDPIKTADGTALTAMRNKQKTNQARHYALHALVYVFPDLDRADAARMVGAPGHPKLYWNASWHQVAKPRASGIGHMAGWFDDGIFGRVIQAIGKEPPAVRERPIATGPAQAAARPPAPIKAPTITHAPGKRALYDMLAAAAQNTAKIKPPTD